ncbi:GNAT family N-acetyltransferase [Dactylosporangium sucinum]|nr:GNAT family N-acetyltransferase [Dactylosporangium sucinum]
MTAPTTPAPVVAPAEDVRITPYDQGMEREVYAVHTAAFRDLWGYQDRSFESWAALTVRSEIFLPELARVALAGDTIVGYVLPHDQAEPGRLYIGQIGTAESWHRMGIASSLLADVLGAAGRAGYTHAALDTDADNPTGAAGVYAKVGFVVDQHLVVCRKPV